MTLCAKRIVGLGEELRRNHRVVLWSPVIPVQVVPSDPAGDILGVFGEFLTEFTNFLGVRQNARRKDRFGKASVLILIAGLAVEAVGLFKTNQLSGRIIATLNEQAERERLARVKIEQQVAVRDLTFEESEAIPEKLSSFSGQHAVIDVFPVNFETVSLALTIHGIFVTSGQFGSHFHRHYRRTTSLKSQQQKPPKNLKVGLRGSAFHWSLRRTITA